MGNEAEVKEINAVKAWLREAVVVFDKVSAAQFTLKSLGNENARAEMKAKGLRAEIDALEKEKAALERMVTAMKEDGKTPLNPLKDSEWIHLLNDTAMGFGGVREYIMKLADFFGAR